MRSEYNEGSPYSLYAHIPTLGYYILALNSDILNPDIRAGETYSDIYERGESDMVQNKTYYVRDIKGELPYSEITENLGAMIRSQII